LAVYLRMAEQKAIEWSHQEAGTNR
jgi:hypothetical protein